MGNKVRSVILEELGRLQKGITFDECHRTKTFYDGVRHGIKLSKKTIEHIPLKKLEEKTNEDILCGNGLNPISRNFSMPSGIREYP